MFLNKIIYMYFFSKAKHGEKEKASAMGIWHKPTIKLFYIGRNCGGDNDKHTNSHGPYMVKQ